MPYDPTSTITEPNPTRFFITLHNGLPATVHDLGAVKGVTSLTTPSPYGTTLAGLTDAQIGGVRAPLLAQLRGPAALFGAPFWTVKAQGESKTSADTPPPPVNAALRAAETAPPDNERGAERYKYMYRVTMCTLCGRPGYGPVHMCTDCPNRIIAQKRATALRSFAETITRI